MAEFSKIKFSPVRCQNLEPDYGVLELSEGSGTSNDVGKRQRRAGCRTRELVDECHIEYEGMIDKSAR